MQMKYNWVFSVATKISYNWYKAVQWYWWRRVCRSSFMKRIAGRKLLLILFASEDWIFSYFGEIRECYEYLVKSYVLENLLGHSIENGVETVCGTWKRRNFTCFSLKSWSAYIFAPIGLIAWVFNKSLLETKHQWKVSVGSAVRMAEVAKSTKTQYPKIEKLSCLLSGRALIDVGGVKWSQFTRFKWKLSGISPIQTQISLDQVFTFL